MQLDLSASAEKKVNESTLTIDNASESPVESATTEAKATVIEAVSSVYSFWPFGNQQQEEKMEIFRAENKKILKDRLAQYLLEPNSVERFYKDPDKHWLQGFTRGVSRCSTAITASWTVRKFYAIV